ncbi:MAG: alpha/beta hydrolase [Bryobacteraceae bacterium]
MAVILAFFCFIGAVLLAGFIYQTLGKLTDRRRFPAPGRLLTIDRQTFHVVEKGAGPTVVLESGIASTSIAWLKVQAELAKEARVIAYDRAGLGWSSPPHTPRTLENVVDELHAVLHRIEAPQPFILVGHSYGGLVVRLFSKLHPHEVAGIVLVDPVETRDWYPIAEPQRRRLARGVMLSRRGALLARIGLVRFALALLISGSRRLPRLISRWSAGKGASVTHNIAGEVRKLPPYVWPMICMNWSNAKCFTAMAEYLERLPRSAQTAQEAGWPTGIPIIALIAAGTAPNFPEGVTHRLATRSGHWIQLDEPELVLEAIRELLSAKQASCDQ